MEINFDASSSENNLPLDTYLWITNNNQFKPFCNVFQFSPAQTWQEGVLRDSTFDACMAKYDIWQDNAWQGGIQYDEKWCITT